jgi:hypothetical protein
MIRTNGLLEAIISVHLEVEPALEEVGDEVVVGVHLDAIPAGVGDHDRGDALPERVQVGGHVDAHQALPVDDGVVLVDAVMRATVADEVLGTRCHLVPAQSIWASHFRTYARWLQTDQHHKMLCCDLFHSLSGNVGHAAGEVLRNVALQARDELCHGLHDLVVLTVALVAPPPPRITADLRTNSKISTMKFNEAIPIRSKWSWHCRFKDWECSPQCMARTRTGCRWLALRARSRHRSSSPDQDPCTTQFKGT